MRNCGRRPEEKQTQLQGEGFYGDEGNFIHSGNYRITEFQAALLSQALRRLPEQNRLRDENAIYLNSQLEDLDGVSPMRRDTRETREAYFNFVFRYHQAEFKGLPTDVFRAALSAELGCAVETCYEPLNACSLYAPLTKPHRYRLTDQYWEQINPARFDLPRCRRAYCEESVCFHFNVLMGTRADIDMIAEAIARIYQYASELR